MAQSLRVLLVEDDEGDALLVPECLREAGVADDDVDLAPHGARRHRRARRRRAVVRAARPRAARRPGPRGAAHGRRRRQRRRRSSCSPAATTASASRRSRRAPRTTWSRTTSPPSCSTAPSGTPSQRRQTQVTECQLREERLLAAENSRLERGLLPRPLLRTDFVSCASHYRPGRARAVLGGDFFDVVETADGRIRAVIGDVMGHGPDEAALGVHLRVAWRGAGARRRAPTSRSSATLARLLEAESQRRHLRDRLRRHPRPRPRR